VQQSEFQGNLSALLGRMDSSFRLRDTGVSALKDGIFRHGQDVNPIVQHDTQAGIVDMDLAVFVTDET
jgi:hypothetical protein